MKLQTLSLQQGTFMHWVRLIQNDQTIIEIDPQEHLSLDERLELAFAYNQLPEILNLLGELLPELEDHKETTNIRKKLQFILDEINYDANIEQQEEKTLPITLGLIKATCGWGAYCDVTGGNHWALNEWSVDDTEIFNVKESHAKTLGIIK